MKGVFLVTALFLGSPFGWTEEPLIWYRDDLYPFTIASGETAGQGVVDQVTDKIQGDLKEYRHFYQQAVISRIFEALARQDGIIYPTALKTPEREKFLHFSRPYLVMSPVGLLIPKSLGMTGLITLSQLAEVPEFRLVLARNRVYGAFLDQLLPTFPAERTIWVSSVNRDFGQAARGWKLQVALGIIGYEAELVPSLEQFGFNRSDFTFLRFENAPEFVLGYMVTRRSPQGQQLMQKIDALLPKYYQEMNRNLQTRLTAESAALHRRLVAQYLEPAYR